MKHIVFFVLLQLFAVSVVNAAGQVNVYSGRQEALIMPALEAFSKKTGIGVNLITGKADALIKRLEIEGDASPADVLITVDAGRLHRAKKAGILQSIESKKLNKRIPAHLRDRDSQWFALSSRLRPIFYHVDRVTPEQLSTYEDLSDEKWQGKICIRSSNNIYNQSLVASMLESNGEKQTQDWLNGFVKNFARPPAGGDTDQLKAIAAGVCDIALVNTYYYGRLVNSENEADRQITEKVKLFWPNQAEGERGAHINVSGAGVAKNAPNKKNAIKLLEFLVSGKMQEWYAQVNNEYPIVEGADIPPVLASWGEFKSDDVALTRLGENNRAALLMMDKADWK